MPLTAYLATLIGFPIYQSRVCLPCLKKRLGPSLFCLFQEYAENWRNLIGWFRRLETLTFYRKSKPNRCISVFFTPNSIRVFVTSNQNKARKKKEFVKMVAWKFCFWFIPRVWVITIWLLASSFRYDEFINLKNPLFISIGNSIL